MFNFKNIALAATIAAGSLFGGVAQAAPTKCAIINDRINLFEVIDCDMSERINSNGDSVMDVTLFGDKRTERISVVWWMRDNKHTYAEVFWNGNREAVESYTSKNGAWCFKAPSRDGLVTVCID